MIIREQPKRQINYTRLNHLYHMGKSKVIKDKSKETERRKREESKELEECTFKP